ncbi:MAG: glycosyltransferase, partial [Patescibacteria group bacterium]
MRELLNIKNKMHIAMISYHACPLASDEGKETGGMNVYVLELSKELAKAGHTVDMFTRSMDASNKTIVEVSPGLRLIHLPGGPFGSMSKKDLFSYTEVFAQNLLDFIKKNNASYDLFHCHYYQSGVVGQLLKKLFDTVPIVMSFHTLALLKNLVARGEQEQENDERIRVEMNLVSEVERIITPSEHEASYLEYLYGASKKKIAVIPPGVNTELFRPIDQKIARDHVHAKDAECSILFVGRIEPLKGIDALLYALKILTVRHATCKVNLRIVGGDISQSIDAWSKPLRSLEKLRRVLHIESLVEFVGQKNQSELPYYYNASDVVVMPSHYESFGMVALEAMACGVPVIMTNVSGITGILDEKHTSLVTSAQNPLLLASQIE